jgi:myo-inositol 2-dehydrogenase/D-chiro-inositol 1-dehydrogenase
MTAVLGRMATYSGKVVTWEAAVKSELSLLPKELSLDAAPPTVAGPDGYYPIATPGACKAW